MNFESVVDELRSANALAEFNAEVTLEGDESVVRGLAEVNNSLQLIFSAIKDSAFGSVSNTIPVMAAGGLVPSVDGQDGQQGSAQETKEKRKDTKETKIFSSLTKSISSLGESIKGFAGGAIGTAVNVGKNLLKGAAIFLLLPALQKVLDSEDLRNFIKDAIPKIMDWVTRFTGMINGIFENGLSGILDAFSEMPITFGLITTGILSKLGLLGPIFGVITSALSTVVAAATPLLTAAAPFIAAGVAIGAALFGLFKLLEHLRDSLGFESIFDVLRLGVAYIQDAFASLANMYIDFGNMIMGLVNKVGKFLGFELELPEFEKLSTDNAERFKEEAQARKQSADEEEAAKKKVEEEKQAAMEAEQSVLQLQLQQMDEVSPVPVSTSVDTPVVPPVSASVDIPVIQTSPPATSQTMVNTASGQSNETMLMQQYGIQLAQNGKYNVVVSTPEGLRREQVNTVAEAVQLKETSARELKEYLESEETRLGNEFRAELATATQREQSSLTTATQGEQTSSAVSTFQSELQKQLIAGEITREEAASQLANFQSISSLNALQQNQELTTAQTNVMSEVAAGAPVTIVNAPSSKVTNSSSSSTNVMSRSFVNPDPFVNGIATAAI